jgi:hypothetical protein
VISSAPSLRCGSSTAAAASYLGKASLLVVGAGAGSSYSGILAGISSSSGGARTACGWGIFARGRPSREGSILRGLSLFGEEGTAEAATAAGRRGDSGRGDGAGEAERIPAGDWGRARREIPETDGLAGLVGLAVKRDTAAIAGVMTGAGAPAGSVLP